MPAITSDFVALSQLIYNALPAKNSVLHINGTDYQGKL